MSYIKKAFKYLWDMKAKRIERIEDEARHPFAKLHDKFIHNNLVRIKGVVPFVKKHKKDLEQN